MQISSFLIHLLGIQQSCQDSIKSPIYPNPIFPIVNIISLCMFITTNESILIYYGLKKSMLSSDFPSLLPNVLFSAPGSHPEYITFRCHDPLCSSALWTCLKFDCFLMILRILRNIDQLFCRMSFNFRGGYFSYCYTGAMGLEEK